MINILFKKLAIPKNMIIISAYLFFFIVGIVYFPSTGRDDSHITYWAAYTLSEYGSLFNYNAETIEQSSSLLHVLILSIFSAILPINIVTLGYILSIAFGSIAIHILTRYMIKKEGNIFIFLPWLVFSLSIYIYWSFGGLESTLATFIFILFIVLFNNYIERGGLKRFLLLGVVIFMMLLVRPEIIIVLLCFFLAMYCIVYVKNKLYNIYETVKIRVLYTGGIFFFSSIIIIFVRYYYTGMFFPLPVIAKSGSISFLRLQEGFEYFINTLFTLNSIIILIILFISINMSLFRILNRKNKFNFFTISLSLLVVIYFAFIITSGGDWMEAGRFFVPILPIIVTLALLLLNKLKNKKVTITIILVIIVMQVITMFEIKRVTSFHLKDYTEISQYNLPSSYSFFEKMNRVHLRDIPLSENLKKTIHIINYNNKDNITIMSPYAGMVIFQVMKEYFRTVKFIDMYGLTTSDVSNCPLVSTTLNSNEGIKMTMRYFFKHTIELESLCNIELPDIIFSRNLEKQLKGQPYFIIYSQKISKIYKGSFNKNKTPLNSIMQIAVHNKYLKLFNQNSTWYW